MNAQCRFVFLCLPYMDFTPFTELTVFTENGEDVSVLSGSVVFVATAVPWHMISTRKVHDTVWHSMNSSGVSSKPRMALL